MKPLHTAEFPVSLICDLKVGVVIHAKVEDLRDTFETLQKERDNDLLAFCHYDDQVVDDRIATLHFYLAGMDTPTVAHEVFHAVLILGRYWRLNIEVLDAEELLADAMEAIMTQTLQARQFVEASIPPSEQHQPSCGPSPS